MVTPRTVILAAALLLGLGACKRESTPAQPAAPGAPAAPQAALPPPAVAAVELKDVIENDPRYVIGISYPPLLNKYPELGRVAADYAGQARKGLMDAVDALGGEKPTAPYELSLAFSPVVDSPTVVAVAADGSRYTGGAHGEPLVARFVWLPQQRRLLTADALLAGEGGWEAVSAYIREQLHTAVSVRAEADNMPPIERESWLRSSIKAIDAGTTPEVENFSQFQPVLDAGGRIAALRFVFPPYQVGSYADGTQMVDVPVQVLRPYLAAEYQDLFAQ